jgi:hypothetical protein
MVSWDNYEVFDQGAPGPLSELPRTEARRAYDRLMRAKDDRIELLLRLLAADSVDVISRTDGAIQDLNDWFYDHVEPDPKRPGRLLSEWNSVAVDIALFLGDVMIERHPHLNWDFFTWGRKNAAYQHAVIMGFRNEDPKHHTNIDVESRVAMYGHRIVKLRGSVPTYGRVKLKGDAEVDLDALLARNRQRGVERDAFLKWLRQLRAREA